MTYRLFLSHSSPPGPARDRLVALAGALEELGKGKLRVLYDKRQIGPGDDWRGRIAFMLHACHGGVVLIDDNALKSSWVLAEATFLSLRHEQDPAIGIFPVSLLDKAALTSQRIALTEAESQDSGSWRVPNLNAVQYAEAATVEELAAMIVQALEDTRWLTPGGSPAELLASQFAHLLAGGSQLVLQELADTLAANAAYLGSQPALMAALAVVRGVLDSGRLVPTRDQLDRLGSAFPDENRRYILDELAPLAYRAESASLLLRRRSSGGHVHTTLCCAKPAETVPGLIRRAHLTVKPPVKFAISGTHGSFEELRAALRQEWRAQSGDFDRTDAEVDQRMATSRRDIYAWLPGPVSEEVLTELDTAYPHVAFIVHLAWTDKDLPVPALLTRIEPALSAAEEDAILVDHEDAVLGLGGWRR